MVKSWEKWLILVKSGEKLEKVGKSRENVVKSWEMWGKVGKVAKSGEKLEKVVKSGEKW